MEKLEFRPSMPDPENKEKKLISILADCAFLHSTSSNPPETLAGCVFAALTEKNIVDESERTRLFTPIMTGLQQRIKVKKHTEARRQTGELPLSRRTNIMIGAMRNMYQQPGESDDDKE